MQEDFHYQAAAFCAEVEGHKAKPEADFLTAISALLANLYAAAIPLTEHTRESGKKTEQPHESLQLWQWVSDSLEPYLQQSDQYRKVVEAYPDVSDDHQTIEGCLANDLAYVYAYLKPALGTGDIKVMAAGFVEAVGANVVDALKAVHYALYEDDVFDDEN